MRKTLTKSCKSMPGNFSALGKCSPTWRKLAVGKNLASIASLWYCRLLAYSASKGCPCHDTECRKDFVDQGIAAMRMSGTGPPSFVDGFLKKFYPDDAERNEKLRNCPTTDRSPATQMTANLAAFLCSDEAAHHRRSL